MKATIKVRTAVNRLLDVRSTDPDEARRRRLLNIILAGVAGLLVLLLLTLAFLAITEWEWKERIPIIALSCVSTLCGTVVLYLINRYGAGWLASTLFLVMVTSAFSFVEEPSELADGRSLVLFSLPIVMASVILPPYASFIMAALSSTVIFFVAVNAEITPNPFAMASFFMLALVSWLAAGGLERALKESRTLNLELDQRVQDRTRDLAESLSQTEAILDSTADGIIVFDNTGTATVANPAVTDLLACPSSAIVGSDFETLMEEQVSAEDKETVSHFLHSEELHEASIKFEWGQKTISASAAPVHLESGESVGTVAVFHDFTREAEIDRMKSTFVSIASHELRTPLNAIMGYTEMLSEEVYGPLTEQQRGAMNRLLANTSHMLGLVNNLLDRARIEAGTIKLNVGTFSPSKLMEGVKGVMGLLANSKGLELTTHIADDVPEMLVGDWQRLHQILINLSNNAVRFTEEGSIDISVRMDDVDHWEMAVSDTGVGIPEDAREYIFEPFRQVEGDLGTRAFGGAGLGLSIVRELVEMMGGRIELESEVGKGSTFIVVLPVEVAIPNGSA